MANQTLKDILTLYGDKIELYVQSYNDIKTVRAMFKWALTQPKRKIKTMEYEIDKGIYSFWK